MSTEDLDRLEQLASEASEEARFGWSFTTEKNGDQAWTQFITAATPSTILALIAEVRTLRATVELARAIAIRRYGTGHNAAAYALSRIAKAE